MYYLNEISRFHSGTRLVLLVITYDLFILYYFFKSACSGWRNHKKKKENSFSPTDLNPQGVKRRKYVNWQSGGNEIGFNQFVSSTYFKYLNLFLFWITPYKSEVRHFFSRNLYAFLFIYRFALFCSVYFISLNQLFHGQPYFVSISFFGRYIKSFIIYSCQLWSFPLNFMQYGSFGSYYLIFGPITFLTNIICSTD